jgi:hypothetical protein
MLKVSLVYYENAVKGFARIQMRQSTYIMRLSNRKILRLFKNWVKCMKKVAD